MQTITELKAWRVAAPDGCALANRDGGHEPYFRRTVVVAKDNQNHIGLAEIPGIQGMDDLIQSPRVQAAVVGRPAIQLRSIVDELDGLVGGDESSDRGDKTWDADLGRHLKSGVEVSVGDLLAQREAVPLADLFGKRRRAACPVNAYGFWHFDPAGTGIEYLPPEGTKGWNYWRAAPAMTVPRLVELFGALLDFTGAKSLKLKAGVFDPETEVQAMLAFRDAYPSIRLTLDPNGCWDVATSIWVLNQLKGAIDYIEDPTWGIENFASVQKTVPTRIATNMAVTRFKHVKPALQAGLDLIVLAGFMRILKGEFLRVFAHRVINIHPSLLPAFPGLEAQRQAIAHGVRVSGATVHLVTSELDGGPIIIQAAVPVLGDDTVDTLSARILTEEHRIYPEAIQLVLDGGWSIEGRRFVCRVR
jgi:formyltetrahydrofolate-dependent phosphoribosylglycinamide formyltransferase